MGLHKKNEPSISTPSTTPITPEGLKEHRLDLSGVLIKIVNELLIAAAGKQHKGTPNNGAIVISKEAVIQALQEEEICQEKGVTDENLHENLEHLLANTFGQQWKITMNDSDGAIYFAPH